MHLVSVLPGVRLLAWNRAAPASSSVSATDPVDQLLPELRVVPLNAAYDECQTSPAAQRIAVGVARAMVRRRVRDLMARTMKLLRDGGRPTRPNVRVQYEIGGFGVPEI